jgi:Ca2+-binding EF-hand superfamily protein
MIARKFVLASLGAALIAGAAIPALAAPGHDGPRPPHGPGMMGHGPEMMKDMLFVRLLKTADTNKDGKISKEELTARQEALFAEIDGNKDGMLSRGELLDYRQAKMEQFRKDNPPPEAADKGPGKAPDMGKPDDGKGGPDRDMADNDGPRHHRHGPDRDGDRRDGPGRHHEWRDGDRREARWDRGAEGDRHGPGMMGRGMFRMIDEDHDGKISKAEAAAASDKLFAFMDTNKDGQITIDDLPDRPL